MKARVILSALILAGFASQAGAQEVAGKWMGSVETDFGPFELVFNFAVEGAMLTGAMVNDMMGEVPISDGMVDGDEVSFRISIDGGPGGAMVINYTGMVEGDELKLTSTFEGGAPPGGSAEQTMTLTRAE